MWRLHRMRPTSTFKKEGQIPKIRRVSTCEDLTHAVSQSKALLASARAYIMRTFYSSYTLEYRVSTRIIRGSLTGGTVRHTHSSSEFSLRAGEAWQQPTHHRGQLSGPAPAAPAPRHAGT